MKRVFLCIIIILVLSSCTCQDDLSILNLQQEELKDDILTKTISDITIKKQDCFKKNEFYIMDFFQSSFSGGEYYLSIDLFVADNKSINLLAYYVTINNINFFISRKVSSDIIKILPSKKEFKLKNKNDLVHVGGDYLFLIWRSLGGYYHILLCTCDE